MVDTVAPDTGITAKPNDPSNNASPSFSFTSTEANSTFECSIDGGSYSACTSPKSLSTLGDGSHTFSVRAKDAAGNVDPTPACYTWTVNAAVPTVTFTPEDTTDVAPNTNVRATFSEAMNEASVETQGTFTLKAEGSSTPVEATVTYNSVTKSATLDPGTDLALNTTYTATLTTEAKDLGGNALAQESTWTFKTANAPRNVTVAPTTSLRG
jgi:Bacterial Ig-like domain